MLQYLIDDQLILDTGDYPGFAFTFWTDGYIDVAYKDVGQAREQERKL